MFWMTRLYKLHKRAEGFQFFSIWNSMKLCANSWYLSDN